MNKWTIGIARRGGGWIDEPLVAYNTWLREGRRRGADMLYQAINTTAYRPFNVIGIGTSAEPVDHEQQGLLAELPPRVVAESVTRDQDVVTMLAEFAAEDFVGSRIREAAIYQDLQGGAAIFRVVYGAALYITQGPGYVIRLQIDIIIGGS